MNPTTNPTELDNFPTLEEALERRDREVELTLNYRLGDALQNLRGAMRPIIRSNFILQEDIKDALDAYRKSQDALEQVAAWMRESHLTGVPMYHTVLEALEA